MHDAPDLALLAQLAGSTNAPRLSLKIKSGQQKTGHLDITAQGLVDSHRKALDGQVFFGTKKKSLPDTKTGHIQILNDFVIKGTD